MTFKQSGRLLPPYDLAPQDDGSYAVSILFPEHFCGVKGVVHGGVVAMLFDEILGWVGNDAPGDWWATASLKVDYRAPTPTEKLLEAQVRLVRRDERKCTVSGRLYADGVLCAEAEGLFVKVR